MEENKKEAIKNLYKSILKNDDLIQKLNLKLKRIANEEDLKNFIKLEIIPIINSKKLEITEKDLLEYEKESMKKLNREDLLDISGGFSPRSLILAGGFASLAMLALGSTGNLSAHAVIDRDIVLSSAEELQKEDDSQKGANQEDKKEGKDKEKEYETLSPQQQNQVGKVASTSDETKIVPSLVADSTTVKAPAETYKASTSVDVALKMPALKTEEEVSQDPQNGLPTETVLTSAVELEKQETHTDTAYVAQALNLHDAYVLNMTGVTENFRFFDGNKEELVAGAPGGDGVPSWDFKKDGGAGSADFMSTLFTSSGGVLNTEGGAADRPCLSKDCEPTPELVAKIAAYIYNHIVNGTQEDAQELQQALASIQEVNLKSYINLKELANIKAEIEDLVKKREQQKKVESKKQRPFANFVQMVNSGDVPAKQLMDRLNSVYIILKGDTLRGENVDPTKYKNLLDLLNSHAENLQAAQQIGRFFSEKLHIEDITKIIRDQDPIKQKKL
ncbi:MAG: hypothetical protein RUMPE_01307 [Eubacteriales bacterium SKADARSKE-1]|nr:hypothetical protein [Eubacteriales bacterium SKADARSKE-1]